MTSKRKGKLGFLPAMLRKSKFNTKDKLCFQLIKIGNKTVARNNVLNCTLVGYCHNLFTTQAIIIAVLTAAPFWQGETKYTCTFLPNCSASKSGQSDFLVPILFTAISSLVLFLKVIFLDVLCIPCSHNAFFKWEGGKLLQELPNGSCYIQLNSLFSDPHLLLVSEEFVPSTLGSLILD